MTQKKHKAKTQKLLAKKSYIPPILSEYGSIAKLTHGGASAALSDHGNNMMRP